MPPPARDPQTLLQRVIAGDRLAIARVLTRLENDASAGDDFTQLLGPHVGRALVVGVTGVPGGGKSTLVSAMLGLWLEQGLRVAVIAIDPSSPISGGAVLGDRFRMSAHAAHPNCFIRSFSARGQLGGLSRTARVAVDCFDAAGYERIVVETVGAGQSETAITSLADTRIVVCPPGLGDDVQAIKAGILEIADLLAVSKGDLPMAQETARDLRDMLALRAVRAPGQWHTQVLVVSAAQGHGIRELLDAVQAHASAAGRGRRARAAPSDGQAWLARLREMAARDGLCAALGFCVTAAGPGSAVVRMTVGPQHLNFNGGCHGGTIFALADTAFGLASNSHGALACGIDAHITYQAGVPLGAQLVARASEMTRGHRIGTYRVDVTRTDGGSDETPVSSFTGTVFIKPPPQAPPEPTR
jgi:LAO/AO transport system ATPase/phenylacetic acid degradation protein PaaD